MAAPTPTHYWFPGRILLEDRLKILAPKTTTSRVTSTLPENLKETIASFASQIKEFPEKAQVAVISPLHQVLCRIASIQKAIFLKEAAYDPSKDEIKRNPLDTRVEHAFCFLQVKYARCATDIQRLLKKIQKEYPDLESADAAMFLLAKMRVEPIKLNQAPILFQIELINRVYQKAFLAMHVITRLDGPSHFASYTPLFLSLEGSMPRSYVFNYARDKRSSHPPLFVEHMLLEVLCSFPDTVECSGLPDSLLRDLNHFINTLCSKYRHAKAKILDWKKEVSRDKKSSEPPADKITKIVSFYTPIMPKLAYHQRTLSFIKLALISLVSTLEKGSSSSYINTMPFPAFPKEWTEMQKGILSATLSLAKPLEKGEAITALSMQREKIFSTMPYVVGIVANFIEKQREKNMAISDAEIGYLLLKQYGITSYCPPEKHKITFTRGAKRITHSFPPIRSPYTAVTGPLLHALSTEIAIRHLRECHL